VKLVHHPLGMRTCVRYTEDMTKTAKTKAEGVPTRKEPSERTKCIVWGRAAGRCTLCNRVVTENDELGEPVPIGELAHNVGATSAAGSPRGKSVLTRDQRAEADNLFLLCRTCHKPVDDGGQVGRWTIDELKQRKVEFEEHIRMLTEIRPERAAYVIRMVGLIRGTAPELSPSTVLVAATRAGIFPKTLPGEHFADVDLDLRLLGDPTTPSSFTAHTVLIDNLVARIHSGVRRGDTERIAVFAFARIPLLIHLGAQLDDKLPATTFNRYRTDNENAWIWPTTKFRPYRSKHSPSNVERIGRRSL
jgi:5-methylcytosine-specific restriction endonuclease McrA